MKRPEVQAALRRALDQLHTAEANVLSAVEEPEGDMAGGGGGPGVWITTGAGEKKHFIFVSEDGSVAVFAGPPQSFSPGPTAVSVGGRPADLPPHPCPACGGTGRL